MKQLVWLLGWILSTSITFAGTALTPEHPDPEATPGDVCSRENRDFQEYRYQEKIAYCQRNVSNGTKSAIYEFYGIPTNKRRYYTIDHFIPLSIGGSNDPANLWPEHKKIKELRLHLEEEVYQAVRDGQMKQSDAIDKIIEAKMNPPLSLKSEYIRFKN